MVPVPERHQGANTLDLSIAASTTPTSSQHAFAIATSFLAAYRFCFDRQHYQLAAFQLHQATERFYAAILLGSTTLPPRTHNIEDLGERAANLHLDLRAALPKTRPEDQRLFALLKKAYIKARYSRRYRITAEDLAVLGERVGMLGMLVSQACQERSASRSSSSA
jgi:HEPN domain-containing protein